MLTNFSVANAVVFGSRKLNIEYVERRAAYVVVIDADKVAMVGAGRSHFLPGGGSLPGEAPDATIAREVREELGRTVRLLHTVGAAIQYFYSQADNRNYEMLAVFYAGEFTNDAPDNAGEHQLEWIPPSQATVLCFHECHAWAVRQSKAAAQQVVGRERRKR